MIHVHVRPEQAQTLGGPLVTSILAVDAYNGKGRWLGTSYHRTRKEAEARKAQLLKAGKYVRT